VGSQPSHLIFLRLRSARLVLVENKYENVELDRLAYNFHMPSRLCAAEAVLVLRQHQWEEGHHRCVSSSIGVSSSKNRRAVPYAQEKRGVLPAIALVVGRPQDIFGRRSTGRTDAMDD
jgi:hypothetical protein